MRLRVRRRFDVRRRAATVGLPDPRPEGDAVRLPVAPPPGPRQPGGLLRGFAGHAWSVAHASALAVGLLGLLVLGATLLAQHTSLLGVRHVQVVGTVEVPEEEVRRAADIATGTPMATVDTVAVERAAARVPGVERVSARRIWPTTIRITVTERVPVLAVVAEDGIRLVDASGVGFTSAVEVPASIRTFAPPDGADEDTVRAAAAAVAALPPDLREQVEEVAADESGSVRLELRDDRTVVWGDASDAERKAAVLLPLLRVEGDVYDVRVPEVAVVR